MAYKKPKRPLGPPCRDCNLYLCVCRRGALSTIIATAWPVILFVTVLIMASACVVGHDGRRSLSPEARAAGGAILQDVLACGLPLALGAVAGEPDYVQAATCHIERVSRRLGQTAEAAPVGTVEHGRDVVRAAKLEQAGETREAKSVARECEATARARLGGEAVEP